MLFSEFSFYIAIRTFLHWKIKVDKIAGNGFAVCEAADFMEPSTFGYCEASYEKTKFLLPNGSAVSYTVCYQLAINLIFSIPFRIRKYL